MSPVLHKVMFLSGLGSLWGSVWEAWDYVPVSAASEAVCKGYGNGPASAENQVKPEVKVYLSDQSDD